MEQKTQSTGRLAVKTSALTFLALSLALIIGVSFYMLAFTASAGDFFSNTFGWQGLGSRLSYAAYTKSCTEKDAANNDGDINLLAAAAERAVSHSKKTDSAGANEFVYNYTNALLAHKNFDEYAEWVNGAGINLPGADYDYFIKGHFHAAAYKRAKTTAAKLAAIDSVVHEMSLYGGYTYGVNNPMSYVARAVAADGNEAVVTALLGWYETACDEITDPARHANLCADAFMVAEARGTAAQKALWQGRIN